MNTYQFKYGKGTIDLRLPEDNIKAVLQGKGLAPLKDPASKIKEVLKHPIKSRGFHDIFKPGDTVAIVISDRTRSTGVKDVLPIVFDELGALGIKDDDIFIMFACGTHRKHTPQEHARIAGEGIVNRVKVYDHDCRDKELLQYLGTTSRGTRVEVNKRVYGADKIIIIGSITYHYFAGYGGGRKSILPGISAFETIQSNHKLLIRNGKADRNCFTGKLDGNPIHEDMMEATKMIGPDFMINTIMSDDGRIAAVFAGDVAEAHRAGCEYLDERCKVDISEKADMVIAAAGGGTKDINFVQSHKAMENASYALKDGGTMVLIAETSEGLPGDEYMKWIELGSAEAILDGLTKNFTIPGHTVLAAFEKAEKFKIIWVSKMDAGAVSKMGMIKKDDLSSALDAAYGSGEEGRSIYIIPQAYNTFPFYAPV